ncbi:hypothetical protein M378DRAFT_524564 [Amanita muscaria Koide BX008]|uniref:Secreted protein n=1 Tax=Amanita muscaria (strain Koide BX008) TaxID=946122 RepID=A0A0C2S145_AMAMK|nr:hypothetical protein M378DRAFT_524564 [Amanita muscaria Koide BX008]
MARFQLALDVLLRLLDAGAVEDEKNVGGRVLFSWQLPRYLYPYFQSCIDVVMDVDSCHPRLRCLSIGRFSLLAPRPTLKSHTLYFEFSTILLKRPTEHCCTPTLKHSFAYTRPSFDLIEGHLIRLIYFIILIQTRNRVQIPFPIHRRFQCH